MVFITYFLDYWEKLYSGECQPNFYYDIKYIAELNTLAQENRLLTGKSKYKRHVIKHASSIKYA